MTPKSQPTTVTSVYDAFDETTETIDYELAIGPRRDGEIELQYRIRYLLWVLDPNLRPRIDFS